MYDKANERKKRSKWLLGVVLCCMIGRSGTSQSPIEMIREQVPKAISLRDTYASVDQVQSSRRLHIVY